MKNLFLIVITASLFWAPYAHSNNPYGFTDFSGQARSVDDYLAGEKWTVVMIWRHDCHVCNEEAAGYAFFHEDNERAQVLGLSIDGVKNKDGAKAFIENHDLPFQNLIGEPQAVASYFQGLTGQRLIGTPSFIVFDPSGKLMAAQGSAVPPDVITRFIESHGTRVESGS